MTPAEYRERIAVLESLVMSLADKLAVVSEHLGVLAERKEVRRDPNKNPLPMLRDPVLQKIFKQVSELN